MAFYTEKAKYADFLTETPFDFQKHSTIGCGGSARLAYYPRSAEELLRLLTLLRADGAEYLLLGNGANVLPPDGNSDKAVICTKKMQKIEFFGNGAYAEVGVTSGLLLRACLAAEKSGAEFLIGIPCTLGGAAFMNAGAGGRYFADIVTSLTVFQDGKLQRFSAIECGYGYKQSAFMENKATIVGVELRLENASRAEILQRRQAFLQRRAHLPRGKSMGCVFKNPDGVSAGELLEKSGVKGMRIGAATVSERHANFILNEGGATSSQIAALIARMKAAVYASYGILLEEEIRYL